MVPNWIKGYKSKQARSLDLDKVSIHPTSSSPSVLGQVSNFFRSAFQSSKIKKDLVLNFKDAQNNELFLAVGVFNSKKKSEFNKIAQALWVDHHSNNDQSSWLSNSKKYLEALKSRHSEVTPAALIFSKINNQVSFEVDGQFYVIEVSVDNKITFLEPAKSDSFSVERTKCIVLVKTKARFSNVQKAVESVIGSVYPQKGAAEILHFKLKALKAKSDVFWFEV